MLEMNEFEKIAKEIIEKKDEEFTNMFTIFCILLTIISVFFCLFFQGSDDLIKRAELTVIVVICAVIVSIPLYFLLKPIMLKDDKEYTLSEIDKKLEDFLGREVK